MSPSGNTEFELPEEVCTSLPEEQEPSLRSTGEGRHGGVGQVVEWDHPGGLRRQWRWTPGSFVWNQGMAVGQDVKT